MDRMREDFEFWFRIQGHIMERHPEYVECYFNPIVQSHWSAWQASRAALCVELPPRIGAKSSWTEGPHMFADEVIEALCNAGVTCK